VTGSQADEEFSERAFCAARDAFAATPDRWELAIRSAVAALLDFLASEPQQLAACDMLGATSDGAALDRDSAVLDRFAELLRPGYELSAQPPPPIASEVICTSVLELIRAHLDDQGADTLPDVLPTATLITLMPFVGPERAERLIVAPAVSDRG
jgi:hypothetical protein